MRSPSDRLLDSESFPLVQADYGGFVASDEIVIRGAREHNLKDVTVTLPRDRLVVITGLSGSGKSSLAFDTLYAEGQRRYVESLSAYARQFLGYTRVKIDGTQHLLEEPPVLDKQIRHTISVVVDRLVLKPGLRARLNDSIETALRLADGLIEIAEVDGPTRTYSERFACPDDGI